MSSACRSSLAVAVLLCTLGVPGAPAQAQGTASGKAAPAAAEAHGVAFIVDLKGEHQVAGKRAQLMGELQVGQTLSVAAGGQLVVMFIKSGHEYSLVPGDYVMQAEQIQVAKGSPGKVTRRGTQWRLDPGTVINVARTATASVRMRGLGSAPVDPDRLRLIGPADTVVSSPTPTLSWQVAPGTPANIRVEQEGKLVAEVSTAALSWKLPRKLDAGKTYRWTVSAGREDKSAEFSVLDAAGQKKLASLPAAQAFSDRLLRAVTLQSLGVTTEARALFAELAAERPDLPELASLAR